MRYWWVNQNQTYKHEINGGYLWSPKTNANGGKNQFYINMLHVELGDVIFSFCDTYIKAVGIVTEKASASPKPTEFGNLGANWNADGWFVKVEFFELASPIKPSTYMHLLANTLPHKYSPLQLNGRGNQGVYLAEVPQIMGKVLESILNGQVEEIASQIIIPKDLTASDVVAEYEVDQRNDILETQKEQLIRARRGQGLFRARVQLIEKKCRVTGVNIKSHLIASHIKPWSQSSDREKLDGNNGLLLAPHIDHLFDKGYLSFSDVGLLIVSSHLDKSILSKWHIDPFKNVGSFNQSQIDYLHFHRNEIHIR
ncbi:MAG TPA: HNH endonuclease signature motif containing protein [Methylophilaceae bacterium]|nr:HNH endonuclease signature motif containing protein [Methylophilaceae bacterium]